MDGEEFGFIAEVLGLQTETRVQHYNFQDYHFKHAQLTGSALDRIMSNQHRIERKLDEILAALAPQPAVVGSGNTAGEVIMEQQVQDGLMPEVGASVGAPLQEQAPAPVEAAVTQAVEETPAPAPVVEATPPPPAVEVAPAPVEEAAPPVEEAPALADESAPPPPPPADENDTVPSGQVTVAVAETAPEAAPEPPAEEAAPTEAEIAADPGPDPQDVLAESLKPAPEPDMTMGAPVSSLDADGTEEAPIAATPSTEAPIEEAPAALAQSPDMAAISIPAQEGAVQAEQPISEVTAPAQPTADAASDVPAADPASSANDPTDRA